MFIRKLFILISFISILHAEEVEYSSKGLSLVCYYQIIYESIYDEENPPEEELYDTLVIYPYLENLSDKEITVLTKINASKLQGVLSYNLTVKKTMEGISLKPALSKFEAVTLAPGEVTSLDSHFVTVYGTDRKNIHEKIKSVSYKVDNKMSEYYGVWSGSLQSIVSHYGIRIKDKDGFLVDQHGRKYEVEKGKKYLLSINNK